MTERETEFRTYDIGIKSWTKMAYEILDKHGNDALVDYPEAKPIKDKPLLTYGAYTCYAGVARSEHSGLYFFHFYEDDARARLVATIGGEPVYGLYGGIPYSIERTSADQFSDSPMKILSPSNRSLGGFNLIANGSDLFYAAGQFNP